MTKSRARPWGIPAASILVCLVAAGGPATLAAQQVAVEEWLVLGPVPVGPPALSAGGDSAVLAAAEPARRQRWPAAGDRVSWPAGVVLPWKTAAAPDGRLVLPRADGPAVVYTAAYLDADRWQQARVAIDGVSPRRAWLDGEEVKGEEVTLDQGKHLLLVAAGHAAGISENETLSVVVEPTTAEARVAASIDARHPLDESDLARIRSVSDLAVDPSGRRVAMVVRETDEANDAWTSHIEVRSLDDGRLLEELRVAATASGPGWSADGRRLAFVTPTDRKDGRGRDLWIWSPGGGGGQRLLRGEPGLGDVQWAADGEWIYFTATARVGPVDEEGRGAAQRLTEVWQRWTNWPDKARLYTVNVEQGTRIELVGDTASSVAGPTLSPDGRRIIFDRDVQVPERPFLRSELWVLDLETRRSRKLLDLTREVFSGPTTFAWSPDGSAVAFCASGREVVEGDARRFSAYENELYAVSLDRPRLRSLSAGFTPQVGSGLGCPHIRWSATDKRIYVAVEDGARTVAARTTRPVDPAAGGDSPGDVTLERLPLPGEVLGAHDFTDDWLVGAVETPVTPSTVYRVRLSDGEASKLAEPSAGALDRVAIPEWQRWSFEDAGGWTIEGWYWTPPDFDPGHTYPLIVFYYGGTLAEKLNFNERLLRYAARGYVVYVLNPAGAPGYGQAFSDLHIDDWGYPAATDILEGVDRFVEAHSFVDPDRIGNFGHSYGGFMTMHLLTRSDRFAASVAIAGISNIADYWGAGWSGYSYTDGTCPACYPWNRRDVFVDRSPLFQADRITTPLLLIHGTGDTNVVPTESEQMFTALRMLGREVELVRVFGENHGIASKPSIRRMRDAMILEWFDKHLRGRPAAWVARWGGGGDTREAATTTADRPRR